MESMVSPCLEMMLIVTVLCCGYSFAGFSIAEPSDPTVTLSLFREFGDDEDDTDQKFTDPLSEIIRIRNNGRRWLAVLIDRKSDGSSAAVRIDNGSNDRYIRPASEIISFDNLRSYCAYLVSLWKPEYSELSTDYQSESRSYILPYADNINPGEKHRFDVRVIGPALLPETRYSPTDTSEEAKEHGFVTTLTLLDMVVAPLIGISNGIDADNLYDIQQDAALIVQSAPQFVQALNQGDWEDVFKKIIEISTTSGFVEELVKRRAKNSTAWKDILKMLGSIKALTGPYTAAAELGWTLGDLLSSNACDTFAVTITKPEIDDIYPVDQSITLSAIETGDTLEIAGRGFDTLNGMSLVYFTTLNNSGVEVQTLKADSGAVYVFDSTLLQVTVPSGYYPGPVSVAANFMSSNDFEIGDDFASSLEIIDPVVDTVRADTLVYSVQVRITDPPEGFGTESGGARRLYIDQVKNDDSYIDRTEFSYSIDSRSLEAGTHTVLIEVALDNHVIRDSVIFIVKRPSTVLFHDKDSIWTVSALFPDGESDTAVTSDSTGIYSKQLVELLMPSYPKESSYWSDSKVSVNIGVSGTGLKNWSIYPNNSLSDPTTRRAALDTTAQPFHLGSDYYWLYIYPETGPYAIVIFRLRGTKE